MFKHKIFIYNSSKSEDRVGYIISDNTLDKSSAIPSMLRDLCDKYDIVIHRLVTKDESLESIVSLDPFFEGVIFHEELEEFSNQIKKLNSSMLPTPLEFSKVLLTKVELDKLQLQKVLYLIYSICLENGYKIFNESPIAYKYGPVFEDVLDEYNDRVSKEKITVEPSLHENVLLSKVLRNNDIFSLINKIVKKVKDKPGGKLIDITHTDDGPWDQVYVEGLNAVIDDDTILKYNHHVRNRLY